MFGQFWDGSRVPQSLDPMDSTHRERERERERGGERESGRGRETEREGKISRKTVMREKNRRRYSGKFLRYRR